MKKIAISLFVLGVVSVNAGSIHSSSVSLGGGPNLAPNVQQASMVASSINAAVPMNEQSFEELSKCGCMGGGAGLDFQ